MGTSVYFCQMPKVLQIVNRLNLGGITYNAASIAARIRPEFETMIVAGMKDDTEESSEFMLKELGLEAVYIPNMMREISPVQDFKAYLHLLKIIRAYKPDIVHTHAAKAGLIGRLAAKTAGVPVIVHTYHGHVFHSYFGKIKTKIILGIERFLGKISTGIIAISEKQKKELGEVYKVTRPEKIHVIELGYDLTPFQTNVEEKRKQFRAQYGIATDTVVIGVIGRLVSIKNLPFLIRIWQRITTAKNLNIKCFLIGDGEDRPQLELLCKETGIAYSTPEQPNRNATLVFTSWIFNPDLALAGVDIVALCSHNEGTPASLIEAQAAGKPIITTDVGGISNIVVPDQTAILIKAGDERSFEDQLLRLIEDAALRNRLSEKGPAFATGRFHFDRLTRDIKDFYRHLLTKHSE